MEEKFFKERNDKFEEIFQDNSYNKLEQKLSLRKSKKNESLMSKRAIFLNNKKVSIYEPEIDKKNLSNKILALYNEEKNIKQEDVQIIILKYFNELENTSQKNDNDSYFILDRILFIISSLPDEILFKVVDYLSLGHKLFDIFENYTFVNKIHVYKTFKILVNISMRKNKELMSKLINQTSIKYIYEFLNNLLEDVNDNSELICEILLFLMNLLEDNSFIQFIYYKYQIFDLFYNYISENKDSLNIKERDVNYHIIAFFSLFIAVQLDEDEDLYVNNKKLILMSLYNLFEYFLINNYGNKDLLLDVVWGLSNILMQINEKDDFMDIICEKYFENILTKLKILIKMDMDFVVPIFRIIGNITSLKDSYCEKFFDEYWSNYLLGLLKDNILPKHKILIVWILHNICAGTNFECIRKCNLDNILLNLLKNENNPEVLYHLLKLYFGIINNVKNIFLNKELVDTIIIIIKKDINEKINLVCCFFCEKIFEDKNNEFINNLNKISFKEILESWSISENEELKNFSSYLLENYYNKNNS